MPLKRISKDECIQRFEKIHGKFYDYSDLIFKGAEKHVEIICPKHGKFTQMPIEHWKGRGCKKCAVEHRVKWSLEDDAFLLENYVTKGGVYCSEKLGKTVSSVRTRASKTHKLIRVARLKNAHTHISNGVWQSLINGAKARGIQVGINQEDVWQTFLKHGKKCALTGGEISFDKEINTASIDRVDSDEDYLKTNIQILHKLVNMCKGPYDEALFYKMCKAVTEHRAHDLSKIEPKTNGDKKYHSKQNDIL
jgi:hypothetical protein